MGRIAHHAADESDTETTHLDVGDVVVFHTDGATDLRPPHAILDADFHELVRRAVERGATAKTIADEIYDALEALLTFPRRDDDIALLVLTVAAQLDRPPTGTL